MKIKMSARRIIILALAALGCCSAAIAQTPILTQHYDNARTGQNTSETILTPTNVSSTTFGKLFTLPVDGYVYAQPLYVPGVSIPGKGTHNVLYVATENDSVYAFDADTGGTALWQVSFLTNGATTLTPSDVGNTQDINPIIGITGTPVINGPTSNTLYVVVNTKESGNIVYRLHALDITTGAEKFGGPVALAASVPGTAPDAVSGQVPFSNQWENQRPGMLLLNGYVYIGFAAHGDNGPWHGWILAYNATTLARTGAWCTSPNGKGNGLWAAGSGLAVDANGYAYVATGNGDDTVATPAPAPSTTIDYGDSVVKVNLANGVLTPTDYFTPYNQSSLDGADSDVGSGGVLVLPDQTGTYPHILVESGKQGHLYVVNRDKMTSDGSHYCNGCSSDPEILQTVDIDGGLWSMPAYWNGNVYVWGSGGALQAYSVTSGVISASATSQSAATSGFPGSTPVISSNSTTNGIVWAAETDAYTSSGPAILRAYSATNVSNLLYASNLTSGRDTMGPAVKFAVPVVTNGKVYVGAQKEVDVFGLLSDQSPAVAPAFSPAGGSYASTQSVTLSSTTAGATFYYTTNGAAPTTSSTLYSGAISVSATTTINAIAVAPGFSQSAVSTATFTIGSQAAPVQFSPAAGTYNSTQSVTLSSTTAGATIYYSTTGTATTSSTVYSGPITVASTATISAIATASGLTQSTATSATYTIAPGTITYAGGFANSTGMQFNGTTDLDDSRLQLTDGGTNQAGSAFFTTPQNIQSFTNNFTFQLSDAQADGITFTIQNSPAGATALGPSGGGLGYGPDNPTGTPGIPNSVAVKYDLYSNNGEGDDSTGLYTDGASPTTPAIDMTSSGVILNNGDTMSVQMTYNGTTLTMTITDPVVAKTFSTSWTVNIPQIVGSNTAYVGFTGGTGGETASQKIETWTFTPTTVTGTQVSTPIINPGSETFSGSVPVQITDATSGSTIYYTTNGSAPVAGASGTTQYAGAITVSATTTVNAIATAPGDTASAEATAVYTQQAAATPVITPGTETFTGTVSVTMSDSTAGSTIYYTTNGNNPVVGASGTSAYSAGFTVSATTTVKAMAVASGFANSGVASATYTLQGTAVTPVISPGTETFTATVSVTMSDSTAGSTIYYTTNGNNPVVGASGTSAYSAGFTVSATTTVKAMAVASGFANSGVASATYTLQGTTATPVITPGTETFTGTVSVTMTDATSGSTIYYTTNGNNPVVGASGTSAYSAGFTVSATTTVKAIATATGYTASAVASVTYTLQSGGSTTPISFGSGFTSSTGFQFNGNAAWNQSASALRLTDTTTTAEAGSVFYTTPVNIQAFTTKFTFQLTNANADGFTFTIQNSAPTALGPSGGGLGYGAASPGGTGGIAKSVAVKFDLYSNDGEGTDSVGAYVNGASPTIPATDMTATGVILTSGDVLNATVTYDGTALILTVSDATKGTSFTQSWDINITSAVGGSTAYVGFTGGTGGETATQQILSWLYTTGNPDTKDPVIFETDALVGQSISSGPTYQEFSCSCFENGLGSQLLATKVGDNVTIPVNVATAGTYDVKVAVKRLSVRGIMQASVNGVNFGPTVDQYDAAQLWQEYDLGTVALAAGSQPIKFTVTGTDPASGSYQITFDYIKLTPQ